MNKLFSIFFAIILLNACKAPLLIKEGNQEKIVLIVARDTPGLVNEALQLSTALEFWSIEKVDTISINANARMTWIFQASWNEPGPVVVIHLKLNKVEKEEEIGIMSMLQKFPGVRWAAIL
jgi:hypothetical protein